MSELNAPTDLFWCEPCHKWVDAVYDVGHESGQFPTAYEDYYTCPTCGGDVVHEFDVITEK